MKKEPWIFNFTNRRLHTTPVSVINSSTVPLHVGQLTWLLKWHNHSYQVQKCSFKCPSPWGAPGKVKTIKLIAWDVGRHIISVNIWCGFLSSFPGSVFDTNVTEANPWCVQAGINSDTNFVLWTWSWRTNVCAIFKWNNWTNWEEVLKMVWNRAVVLHYSYPNVSIVGDLNVEKMIFYRHFILKYFSIRFLVI